MVWQKIGMESELDTDPRHILDKSPMSLAQIVAVAVLTCLNALDGFDVLSISFAAPGITREWGIDRAALGWVLSMELLGMAVGSIFIGGLTDKIGRRPVMLACLMTMAAGMALVTTVHSLEMLSLWRVLTGLGIGGMLAATNAATAETSNTRSRNMCVAIMVIGYPLGNILGGLAAQYLLAHGGWRNVFALGAAASALLIPVVWLLVPETIGFLLHRRPKNALTAVNAALRRFGHAPVGVLPPQTDTEARATWTDLFKPAHIATTLLITLAYCGHIFSFYYLIKWIPNIVVDLGFKPSTAAGVLVWVSAGGALGGALLGLFTRAIGLKPITLLVLGGSAVALIIFGRGQADLNQLILTAFVASFFTNAGISGLYATFVQVFPTHIRAAGTGFAIGVGRFAGWFAPIIAGYLFKSGLGLQSVSALMGVGSLVALCALFVLRYETPMSDGG
jgi:benzoate transport